MTVTCKGGCEDRAVALGFVLGEVRVLKHTAWLKISALRDVDVGLINASLFANSTKNDMPLNTSSAIREAVTNASELLFGWIPLANNPLAHLE